MAMTDDEIRQAAGYFSSIKWDTRWVRVVETENVPRTRLQGNLFIAIEDERTEPLAGRIIEVPADQVQRSSIAIRDRAGSPTRRWGASRAAESS